MLKKCMIQCLVVASFISQANTASATRLSLSTAFKTTIVGATGFIVACNAAALPLEARTAVSAGEVPAPGNTILGFSEQSMFDINAASRARIPKNFGPTKNPFGPTKNPIAPTKDPIEPNKKDTNDPSKKDDKEPQELEIDPEDFSENDDDENNDDENNDDEGGLSFDDIINNRKVQIGLASAGAVTLGILSGYTCYKKYGQRESS